MTTVCIKLKNGNDVLGEMIETEEYNQDPDYIDLKDPYIAEIIHGKILLSPYCYYSNEEVFKFWIEDIELLTPVKSSIRNQYREFVAMVKLEETKDVLSEQELMDLAISRHLNKTYIPQKNSKIH